MAGSLRALIRKLNTTTRDAMEAAAKLCARRTNYEIEIEHFLVTLMDAPGSDLALLLPHFGVNRELFSKDLSASLDRLKRGNARNPVFSPTLVRMFEEAWAFGSLEYEARQIRSSFAIAALVLNEDLRRLTREISREFVQIDPESLKKDLWSVASRSDEPRGPNTKNISRRIRL
jgi:type VI secretion system protein VasG